MSFTQSSFGPISSHGNSDMPNIWTYRSLDDIATISALGYFQDKIAQINDGDFIMLDCSDDNVSGIFIKSGLDISINTDISGFNPTTSISIDRILDGISTTSPQQPAGLGVANAKQIDFGVAVNTGADPLNLLSDGTLEVNTTGLYRIKVALQFGRSGASGTSVLLFRVLVNGAQAGRSIVAKLSNADDEMYFENDTWITLPSGASLTYEVMRDSSGSNFGGLFGFDPTIDGGNEWGAAPSAALRVERWTSP